MKKSLIYLNIFFLPFNYFFTLYSYTKIINLPQDAETLQEGIEMASDGDTIQVNQHDVPILNSINGGLLGIRIVNKDLTIIGMLPNEKVRIINYVIYGVSNKIQYQGDIFNIPPTSNKNCFSIENSEVVFKNLDVESIYLNERENTTIAPFQIVSGKLTFENVCFNGVLKLFCDVYFIDSIIFGNSYFNITHPYRNNSGAKAFPAIYIYKLESPDIKIINSQIQCDTEIGSRPIVFEEISNGNIDIINTKINAGRHYNYDQYSSLPDSYWDAIDMDKGLAGILIVNCTDIKINFTDSITIGGNGNRRLSSNPTTPSGPGIESINTNNLILQNGESRGCDGIKGWYDLTNKIYFPGGDGGNGLFITNSLVHLYNHTTIGGKGGEGDPKYDIIPGQDGQPIYQDENSEVIIETNVYDWMLYSN